MAAPARAADAGDSGPLRRLRAEKARLALAETRSEYERALKLQEEGLIAAVESERKRVAFLRAEVEYREALLLLGALEGRVVIRAARKARDRDGRIIVRVALSYVAEPDAPQAPDTQGQHPPQEVAVSLRSDGFVVAEPYEVRVGSMGRGDTREASFVLLRDVDAIEVWVERGGGTEVTKVYLLKGGGGDSISVTAFPPSQEAELGGPASFELSLERFTRDVSVFRIETRGLPHEVAVEFIDPQSNARLSQIIFPEGTTTMKAQMRLYLPSDASTEVSVDRRLAFELWCVPVEAKRSAGRLGGGRAVLELIPRGKGRLVMDAANLYQEIAIGEAVSLTVKLKNAGTRALENVRVAAETPLNWRAEVRPDLVRALDPAREESVTVRLIPPSDVVVGDYEARLKPECTSYGRRVEGEEKLIRVHLKSRGRLMTALLVAALLAGVVVALIAAALRLAKA